MKITIVNHKKKIQFYIFLFMLNFLKHYKIIKDFDINVDLMINYLKKFKKCHKKFVLIDAKSSDGERLIIRL